MEELLVLNVKSYDFTDNNGRRVAGCQVYYLDEEIRDDGQVKGQEIIKISGPSELEDCFKTVPGFYKLAIKTRPGSGGKATIRVVGAEFIAPVSISKLPKK